MTARLPSLSVSDPAPRHSLDRPPGGIPPERQAAYWKRNLRLLAALLLPWAAVSFGAGILFRDWLDQWTLPGSNFPLGFWFAQQGSILSFIALIFIYAWRMNRLDREFGVRED